MCNILNAFISCLFEINAKATFSVWTNDPLLCADIRFIFPSSLFGSFKPFWSFLTLGLDGCVCACVDVDVRFWQAGPFIQFLDWSLGVKNCIQHAI